MKDTAPGRIYMTDSGDPVPAGGCYYSGKFDLGDDIGADGASENFLELYHSTYVIMYDIRLAGLVGCVNSCRGASMD